MSYFLRDWRTLNHLSQGELASASGVDQGTISDIETNPGGKRHQKTIGKLAKALGITDKDLERAPGPEEWEASAHRPISSPTKAVEEFRLRGGGSLSFEEKEKLKARLSEEIEKRKAERARLERIQQLEDEERELERIRKNLSEDSDVS